MARVDRTRAHLPYHGSTEEGVMLASQPSSAVSEAVTAADTSCRFQWPSPRATPQLCGQRPGSRTGVGAWLYIHGCHAPPTPAYLRGVDIADPEPATPTPMLSSQKGVWKGCGCPLLTGGQGERPAQVATPTPLWLGSGNGGLGPICPMRFLVTPEGQENQSPSVPSHPLTPARQCSRPQGGASGWRLYPAW